MANKITAVVTVTTEYEYEDYSFSYYGTTKRIYTMTDAEGTVYVWKTTGFLQYKTGEKNQYGDDVEIVAHKNDRVEITGTVKGQTEYKGQPQTELTRVKVTKIIEQADAEPEETLEDNLDSIANALGNKGASSREVIRNYFLNDFFKDHCQTYSVTGSGKRPIYWLFDSGKQNGFKALIYLHRYNADTIGNLRIDYLHRMQRIYESEISRMQDMIDHSTSGREVAQATKRREKLTKQLKECREYDEKLAHLALSRIELDLDDGVKKNYRKIQTANDGKFYEVLADSKNIMSKE